ncbi:MAG: putative Outer rane channel [Acidobacteria bacterium]|nr:putative Outer rane channel [Acidobacteriota bacterium]
MAIEQTILFTVMPRGITADGDTMPVSVLVSPRLEGADNLGAFRDWLRWTRRLRTRGLELELRCGTRTFATQIDHDPLRPDLWEELFNEETFVRSHQFDDYSDRAIISYPVRDTLSAIKGIYQKAGVTLALPADNNREQSGNRGLLMELVHGMEIHWNGDLAKSLRDRVRVTKDNWERHLQSPLSGELDHEGLITGNHSAGALQNIAVPFSVFHHMPTPEKRNKLKIDKGKILDFHQALTALNAYPELLRALGLVFDLELPRKFIPETGFGVPGTIFVQKVTPGTRWAIVPETPKLETAYIHAVLEGKRLFLAAPRPGKDLRAPFSIFGLLVLQPELFGLAQVDVDGGMHKTIMLAETMNPSGGHNVESSARPERAQHSEVFDPDATLPSLRSGGFSLYADRRALQLLDTLGQSKEFNDAVTSGGKQKRPFFAEDLNRGYRLDIWDSRTNAWHSLHLRRGQYQIGAKSFVPKNREEGFVQLAAMQPAKGAQPATTDLYLHEAIARWSGWSLSAPTPAKHLSRYPNPADAVPRDDEPEKFAEDEAETPFKMTTRYEVLPGSLPRLCFGVRYRIRARAVDLAGNSLAHDNEVADLLSSVFGLPRDAEGFTYLRFEPVGAPVVIIRDERAVKDPGSAVDRLVIRTFNSELSKDGEGADLTAADRHILPPRTSVEMGERLGMFDDAAGKLKSDAATYQLIVDRDAGEFNTASIDIKGKVNDYPLEAADRLDDLPYLPDPLSRGAAIRDLPGSLAESIGKVTPDSGGAGPVQYDPLNDPNPRAGSATLISFGDSGDWQDTRGFRLRLDEPVVSQAEQPPHWDPDERVLTVLLAKGRSKVVPLTSYLTTDDLKLMGVWQWLREYIADLTENHAQQQFLVPGLDIDRIAHVLQRAVEGGHWMLTPPRLLTLVHAVQQPIGRPEFTALHVEHQQVHGSPLETAPNRGVSDPTELAPITAWRRPGATDAYLTGALKVHGAGTARIDIMAAFDDPVDDGVSATLGTVHRTATADELSLAGLNEDYLYASETKPRAVGYYDPEHDQIAFTRAGDWTGNPQNPLVFAEAAPRHILNDTKHHVIKYTAVATSRFREYFPDDQEGGFTRQSEEVTVDVPASARPLAPDIAYVVPTFGWQRQVETNMKRSVRFGGGLRVYFHRPWFSSGEGELLGVTLWNDSNGDLEANRDKFKSLITQWGMDPIWQTSPLGGVPAIGNFTDSVESDSRVSLEESRPPRANGGPVDVVGFKPEFDPERKLWFADLTIDTFMPVYMPFVRLALVRYQPHALPDAMISRVVLADFAQLTPDRSALVTADPHHPRTLRVVVSGVAPRGPKAVVKAEPKPTDPSPRPTRIQVRVQRRDPDIESDLTWKDVPKTIARVDSAGDAPVKDWPDLVIWKGTVVFTKAPEPGEFRLLIEEHEYISANYTIVEGRTVAQPGRLIYAEAFELDDALVSE